MFESFRLDEFRKILEVRLDDIAHVVEKAREHDYALIDRILGTLTYQLRRRRDPQLMELKRGHYVVFSVDCPYIPHPPILPFSLLCYWTLLDVTGPCRQYCVRNPISD